MSQTNPTPEELERYCRAWIKNGGSSQRQAFRETFPNSKANDETADVKASLLHSSDKVKIRLAEIRAAEVPEDRKRTVLTKADALERLAVMTQTKAEDFYQFYNKQVGEDDDGLPVYVRKPIGFADFDTLPDAKRACVKSMYMTAHGPRVELYDVQAAFKIMADLEGWNAPKGLDLSNKDGTLTPTVIRRTIVDPKTDDADL